MIRSHRFIAISPEPLKAGTMKASADLAAREGQRFTYREQVLASSKTSDKISTEITGVRHNKEWAELQLYVMIR